MRFVAVQGEPLGEAAIGVIEKTSWLDCATALVPGRRDCESGDVVFFAAPASVGPVRTRVANNRHGNTPGPWLFDSAGNAEPHAAQFVLINRDKGVDPSEPAQGFSQAVIVWAAKIAGKRRPPTEAALSRRTRQRASRREDVFTR